MKYILLALLLSGCVDYSNGSRVGFIKKLSRKGIFCKTWEGEAIVGPSGMINPEEFSFTISDANPDVVNKAFFAMKEGKRVQIHYNEQLFTSLCKGDTNYFISEVFDADHK